MKVAVVMYRMLAGKSLGKLNWRLVTLHK